MTAVEFIQKFGWEEVKDVLSKIPLCAHSLSVNDRDSIIYLQKVEDSFYWYNKLRKQYDYYGLIEKSKYYEINDLKQLVDAWELVESLGGLQECYKHIEGKFIKVGDWNFMDIKQAIELVESVNE